MKLLRFALAGLCILAAGWIVVAAGLPDRRQASARLIQPLRPGQTLVAPEVGAFAPPLNVIDSRGRRISLAERRAAGKTVILNFWASWCAPCATEMPELDAIARSRSGVQVIGVNYSEPLAAVLNWAERFRFAYPLVPDPDGRAAWLYGVRAIPTTVFIDRNGVIFHIENGALNREQIERLLGTS